MLDMATYEEAFAKFGDTIIKLSNKDAALQLEIIELQNELKHRSKLELELEHKIEDLTNDVKNKVNEIIENHKQIKDIIKFKIADRRDILG